jgi:transcriptional regulator of acetoin/glycerol metabolism
VKRNKLPDLTPWEDAKRLLILSTLKGCGNNHAKTARTLGISYPTLLRHMKKFGVKHA